MSACAEGPRRARTSRRPNGRRGRLRRSVTVTAALLAALTMVNSPAHAAEAWQRQRPPLSTPWTHLVGPNNALPEYPRPQMARQRWLNLNGVWAYTGRSHGNVRPEPPR